MSTETIRTGAHRIWVRTVGHVSIILAVGAVVLLVGNVRYVLLGTEAAIFGLFALSLYLLLAYGGLLSFGHAAFLGGGGYATALLLVRYDTSLAAALIAAPAVAGVIALILGWFSVRAKARLYFAMLTLAFAQLLYTLVFKMRYFGGADGLVGIPPGIFGGDPSAFFGFVVVCLAVVFVIVAVIGRSSFGLSLQATRDNDTRAEFVGLPVQRVRLAVFVVSGALAGVAGGLLAVMNRAIFPDVLFWTVSGEVLIMVLLGGMGTIWGPIIGALALTVLRRVTSELSGEVELLMGGILIVIVLIMPGGIAGIVEDVRDRVQLRIQRRSDSTKPKSKDEVASNA